MSVSRLCCHSLRGSLLPCTVKMVMQSTVDNLGRVLGSEQHHNIGYVAHSMMLLVLGHIRALHCQPHSNSPTATLERGLAAAPPCERQAPVVCVVRDLEPWGGPQWASSNKSKTSRFSLRFDTGCPVQTLTSILGSAQGPEAGSCAEVYSRSGACGTLMQSAHGTLLCYHIRWSGQQRGRPGVNDAKLARLGHRLLSRSAQDTHGTAGLA